MGRVRSGQEFFKTHGSGRIKSFSNLTGRLKLGQEVMRSSRVGSGHDENGSFAGRASMTRELVSADPRVGPAHPARGSDTQNSSRSFIQRLLSYQYSILALTYHIQTSKRRQIHLRVPASIHTHYSQATYCRSAQK